MSKPRSWDALRSRLAREQTILVSLAVSYVIAGKLGLAMSYGHPAVSLVWPPSGIALAALLLHGYRVWPVVFGAATMLYVSTLGPVSVSLALAGGNTIEAVLAAYLVNRFAGGR